MSRLLRALALVLALAPAAQAAPVRTEHVEAELVAESAAAAPGRPATVGLRLKMDEHWHTYWRNPGDSGLPTKIRWTLPEGWKAGPIQWPYPEAQRVGPLMNYGYSDEVMLLVELTPPADARPGPVTLRADADWLVCKDICIPEKASLSLPFAVAGGEPQAAAGNAALFSKARARLPVAVSGWSAESAIAGTKLTLRVLPPAGGVAPARVSFFPFRENFVDHPAPQALVRDGHGVRLEVKLVEPVASDIKEVAGLLVAESSWPSHAGRKAVEIAMPVVAALPAAAAPVGAPSGEAGASLALALLFALAGGLLLNLMPCVFPVLGIKVMGFVRHAHGDARALWMQGAVFSAGVLLSFLALAGLLLALRAGGAELGWGFQLQSPAFVTLLAAL
ncbi:MAG: thiol:disulfide interchange protein, partial [Betaproteobacteria bacterium]|nr:thiol:disulfide interchange protein [Betaproteobacteria bacterium]